MKIINGMPSSPYYIFINGISGKSDLEILSLLNLEIVKEIYLNNIIQDEENYIYLSRDENWVHLMDNLLYSHWYSKEFSNQIEKLGKKLEIFTCSVGDSDLSFDFKYYNNGKKVREYVVESPNYIDEILKLDIGIPIKGEQEGLKKDDQLERVLFIAQQLGVKLPKLHKIKCFEVKNSSSSS